MPRTDSPPVEVVHRLGRRVHLRAPSLALHRSACQRIADRLAREFDGYRISVRPQTGSVIAEAESGTADAELLVERLASLLAAEHDDDGRALLERTVDQGPTRFARAVLHAVRGVNEDVRAAFDGKADIATLAPLFLAASSGLQATRRGEVAPVPWYNLLWFAMNSFLAFNALPHLGEAESAEVADNS